MNRLWETQERLRIYIGESARIEGQPAYEYIVKAAHERGLAGANVVRGVMGYSGLSEIHTSKILRMSEDLPIMVEIIDCRDRIERFSQDILVKLKQAFLVKDSVETVTIRPEGSSEGNVGPAGRCGSEVS